VPVEEHPRCAVAQQGCTSCKGLNVRIGRNTLTRANTLVDKDPELGCEQLPMPRGISGVHRSFSHVYDAIDRRN
jgi:hypothetical protein